MSPQRLLRDFTTFRLGGPCRAMLECRTPEELLAAVRQADGDFILIGGGSNLLVSDAGVDAAFIRYLSATPDVRREGEELRVSGSTLLDDLARVSAEAGLDGLICCTGIPGTVGGAIAGNAGAFGEQIGDRVASVTLMDRSGRVREAAAAELGFAYRRSSLQATGDIVVAARLKLDPARAEVLGQRRQEILALRASKHPDWRTTPTAGSFFKNIEPTSNAGRRQAAGWFLDQAGAKDLRVGGARTYGKHANIIIAEPGCTAQDVCDLAVKMAEAVRAKFGLRLRREVRLLGAFRDPPVAA
jgi:UDP-N-acetylmuramate dehydrogenase